MKRNFIRRQGVAAALAFASLAFTSQARADDLGFGAKFAVSGGYGHVFNVPFYGAGLSGEIGGDVGKAIGIYGGIHYERARTEYGLPIHFGQFGITVEGILDRVRLGGGIHVPYFGFERKSTHDVVDKFGIGLHLSGTVDIIHSREFNLFLGLRPQFEVLGRDRMLNAHVDLGVRF